MGITVYGDKALKLLELLEKMDERYVPTKEEWAYLDRIVELDLSDTDISTLPESFCNLTNLRELEQEPPMLQGKSLFTARSRR